MQPLNQQQDNAGTRLMQEEWKSEDDYKRTIIALQLQNQRYRNELYELGETVNKILDKTKLPQTNKVHAPNLQQQLQLLKKELHNVNQFIEIYQKELQVLGSKKKQDQIDTLAQTEELLKAKQEELTNLKKEAKEITHRNKALEYKLMEYNRKNKAKSLDQQALQLKELVIENKNLKNKLQELQQLQNKKNQWLKTNLESAKNLQLKVQETKLPKIQNKKVQQPSSLPKMMSQKKIYTKWLESNKEKSHSKLQKQLQDLQKINRMVQEKIMATTNEIRTLQDQIGKAKQKVQETQLQLHTQVEVPTPRKDTSTMVRNRVKKSRRDWIGKFDSIRFSDSRFVREQSRLYRVIHHTAGYLQFHYYTVKDPQKKIHAKLPFDPTQLPGKESVFTVQTPDFIKNVRLKLNTKTQHILEIHFVSNLGLQAEFILQEVQNIVERPKKGAKNNSPPPKQQHTEVNYEMDVKTDETINTVFGSYGVKMDEKKNVIGVWMEGFGVQLIQDFVEELI